MGFLLNVNLSYTSANTSIPQFFTTCDGKGTKPMIPPYTTTIFSEIATNIKNIKLSLTSKSRRKFDSQNSIMALESFA